MIFLFSDLIESLKIDGKQIPIGKVFLRSVSRKTSFRFKWFRLVSIVFDWIRNVFSFSLRRNEMFSRKTRQFIGISFVYERNKTSNIGNRKFRWCKYFNVAVATFIDLSDSSRSSKENRNESKKIFLQKIFKATPEENFDRNDLENALEKANELRATINNVIDDEINRIKFDWLEKHVDSRKIHDEFFWNSFTHFGDQRQLIHYGPIRCSPKGFLLDAMLFNDFLLLTRRKNRFLTKIRRIFHRKKSNVDLFDDDQIDLIIFKKVNVDFHRSNSTLLTFCFFSSADFSSRNSKCSNDRRKFERISIRLSSSTIEIFQWKFQRKVRSMFFFCFSFDIEIIFVQISLD